VIFIPAIPNARATAVQAPPMLEKPFSIPQLIAAFEKVRTHIASRG